jgi:hypothetical protein
MAPEIQSPIQKTVILTLATVAFAGAGPETAVSVIYEVESEPEISVTAPATIAGVFRPDSDLSDSLEWQDLVSEATCDHRSMEPWERKATDTFFDSLFD